MTYSLVGKRCRLRRTGLIFWRLSLAACRSVVFQVLILSLQSFEH
jgi:hypothetical protein